MEARGNFVSNKSWATHLMMMEVDAIKNIKQIIRLYLSEIRQSTSFGVMYIIIFCWFLKAVRTESNFCKDFIADYISIVCTQLYSLSNSLRVGNATIKLRLTITV